MKKNRLDHILPQGYLNGFTNPDVPGRLWVFDCTHGKWFDSGTARVAAERGFYDYSGGGTTEKTADEAFKDLENRFPAVRKQLLSDGFIGWECHLELLLHFAQMLRARSRLFRKQTIDESRGRDIGKLAEIVYRLRGPDHRTLQTGLRLASQEEEERENFLRDKAITDMRTEIEKGSDWLRGLTWQITLASDPKQSFVTSDSPVTLVGDVNDPVDAIKRGNAVVHFPICWQACLIGMSTEHRTESALPSVAEIRNYHFKKDKQFIYSPVRLDSHISGDGM